MLGAFDDVDTYDGDHPSSHYLRRLLDGDSFIAIAALKNGSVVGGIAGYELRNFERERSEIYIHDLAVLAMHRREAYVIFVQADTAVEGAPAIAQYTKLGAREDVLHFDIDIVSNHDHGNLTGWIGGAATPNIRRSNDSPLKARCSPDLMVMALSP